MATQLNDWLSIDKASGTGNAQITLTASSYSELVDRAASLRIQAQSTNAILNVRQTALVPSATLDSYEITAYRAGTYTNGITSNVPWTAVVNGDWITIDKTQGESGYTPLSITVDDFTETRNGSITFNAEGVVLTLQIYQIYDLNQRYFWVEFEEENQKIWFERSDSLNTGFDLELLYSFDGIEWVDFWIYGDGNVNRKSISMGNHKKIYINNYTGKMLYEMHPPDVIRGFYLNLNERCNIGGDILTLATMRDSGYYGLFRGSKIVSASDLILPNAVARNCYNYMFGGCTNLLSAPELPALTLAKDCYNGMFQGCTSLTIAPELPATTLSYRCYTSMFANCTSIVNAPKLPATILEDYCYARMFFKCTNLKYIKMLATDISAYDCLYAWTQNIFTNGTFVKHPDANLPTGMSGIPEGWTVETATE